MNSVWSQLYLMFKILESVSVLMLALWLVLIKATWEKILSTSTVLIGCMTAMLFSLETILFNTCLFIDLQILTAFLYICNNIYINNESCRCLEFDAKSWKCSAERHSTLKYLKDIEDYLVSKWLHYCRFCNNLFDFLQGFI
jgi:hypothetical protein